MGKWKVEQLLKTAKWCEENSSGIYRESATAADMLREYAAHLAAQAEWPSEGHARMSDELRSRIEGMSVSVDVSTGDEDAGNRYFGTVTEVMDDRNGKHRVTLLVQDAKPNFVADQVTNEAIEALRDVDAVVTRWRETGREPAYHQWLTLQDIVRAALQSVRLPFGLVAEPLVSCDGTSSWEDVPNIQSPKHGDDAHSGLRYVMCQVGFGSHYADWLLIPHADGQYVTAAKLTPFSMGILRSELASRHAPTKEQP